MRQEAEWYQRPEYGLLLFGPDGIKRKGGALLADWQ